MKSFKQWLGWGKKDDIAFNNLEEMGNENKGFIKDDEIQSIQPTIEVLEHRAEHDAIVEQCEQFNAENSDFAKGCLPSFIEVNSRLASKEVKEAFDSIFQLFDRLADDIEDKLIGIEQDKRIIDLVNAVIFLIPSQKKENKSTQNLSDANVSGKNYYDNSNTNDILNQEKITKSVVADNEFNAGEATSKNDISVKTIMEESQQIDLLEKDLPLFSENELNKFEENGLIHLSKNRVRTQERRAPTRNRLIKRKDDSQDNGVVSQSNFVTSNDESQKTSVEDKQKCEQSSQIDILPLNVPKGIMPLDDNETLATIHKEIPLNNNPKQKLESSNRDFTNPLINDNNNVDQHSSKKSRDYTSTTSIAKLKSLTARCVSTINSNKSETLRHIAVPSSKVAEKIKNISWKATHTEKNNPDDDPRVNNISEPNLFVFKKLATQSSSNKKIELKPQIERIPEKYSNKNIVNFITEQFHFLDDKKYLTNENIDPINTESKVVSLNESHKTGTKNNSRDSSGIGLSESISVGSSNISFKLIGNNKGKTMEVIERTDELDIQGKQEKENEQEKQSSVPSEQIKSTLSSNVEKQKEININEPTNHGNEGAPQSSSKSNDNKSMCSNESDDSDVVSENDLRIQNTEIKNEQEDNVDLSFGSEKPINDLSPSLSASNINKSPSSNNIDPLQEAWEHLQSGRENEAWKLFAENSPARSTFKDGVQKQAAERVVLASSTININDNIKSSTKKSNDKNDDLPQSLEAEAVYLTDSLRNLEGALNFLKSGDGKQAWNLFLEHSSARFAFNNEDKKKVAERVVLDSSTYYHERMKKVEEGKQFNRLSSFFPFELSCFNRYSGQSKCKAVITAFGALWNNNPGSIDKKTRKVMRSGKLGKMSGGKDYLKLLGQKDHQHTDKRNNGKQSRSEEKINHPPFFWSLLRFSWR